VNVGGRRDGEIHLSVFSESSVSASRTTARGGQTLFPREHGAYGQLAFPVLTSLAVAGVSATGLLIALSAAGGFLMHEPVLVLLGRRGPRAKREQGRAAIVFLVAAATTAIGAGVLSVAWTRPAARWSFALPLVPAALLALAIGINHEKRPLGEIAAALSFSFVSAPIALASGAPVRAALSVAIAFAAMFVTATLAVRVVVLRVRGGGNPRAERATRLTVLILSSSVVVVLAAATLYGLTPWPTIAAAAPGLIGATGLSLLPPSPARLRTVGWTLVAASALAGAILIVGL
jgi:YwiC-like protein